MPQTYFDAEGKEVEAVPLDEANKIQEENTALLKEREELLAEKQRLEAGGADKDENFKSFRTKLEGTEKQLEEVNKRLADKEEYEKKSIKDTLLEHFAGADEDSKKRLEEEYALINIAEDTPENIAKRMEKAARVSGLYKEASNGNPVFRTVFGGGAPILRPTKSDGQDDNIVNTDRGKAILGAMGVPTEEKK